MCDKGINEKYCWHSQATVCNRNETFAGLNAAMVYAGVRVGTEPASRLSNSLVPSPKSRRKSLQVFTSLVWRSRGSNPGLLHPRADALTARLWWLPWRNGEAQSYIAVNALTASLLSQWGTHVGRDCIGDPEKCLVHSFSFKLTHFLLHKQISRSVPSPFSSQHSLLTHPPPPPPFPVVGRPFWVTFSWSPQCNTRVSCLPCRLRGWRFKQVYWFAARFLPSRVPDLAQIA